MIKLAEIVIEKQNILSKILTKINSSSINSQAYILSCEDEKMLEDYSLLLSKVIICPKTYSKNCELCNICYRVSHNSYGDLKIIEPVNNVIKKEEILKLKNEFNTNSLEGKNRIYIIKNVEKLNTAAANSLLKFLEEPDSNVVAIFTTTNIDLVMKTILSRCQVIKLNNISNKKGMEYVKKVSFLEEEQITKLLDYFFDIENNLDKAKYTIKEKILDVFKTRQDIKNVLSVLLLIYKDLLNYKLFNNLEYFEKEIGIKNISEKLTVGIITKKISFILENLTKIEYNVNISLFIMNFLIGLGEIQDGKSSRY